MRLLQWLHRWTSLFILLQVLLWLITGLYFSAVGHRSLEAHQYRQQTHVHEALRAPSSVPINQLALPHAAEVSSITLRRLHGTPQYVVTTTAHDTYYFNALTGAFWQTSAEQAITEAKASYRGPGEVIAATKVTGSDEIYGWQQPGFRIDFADDLNTRVYVNGASGTLVDHRNDSWVWADWAFRLHFMDYSGGRDFNHLLMVSAAVAMLWFSLSGLILLGRNLVRGDLNPRQKATYLAYFQAQQQPIASACGGGGTCGLCTVQFETTAPAPTAADTQQLTGAELTQGIRLGCQHRVQPSAQVHVVGSDARDMQLTLVSKRLLTPTVTELTFQLSHSAPLTYRAGQFMQFVIPHPHTVRRNYSLASTDDRQLVFAIRSMPAPRSELPAGVGSSYLTGLQPGAQVRAIGPMGEFALTDPQQSQREQVFIGGGVGIAPLRAMLRHELSQPNSRPSHLFYGARLPNELCYHSEFQQLAEQGKLAYHACVSDVPESAEFVHERVAQWLADKDLTGFDIYVCGPPAMLSATLQMLSQLKVPLEHIRYDDFGI